MGRFINPFTDWGFKRLFGQEFSKELLISFLNDLLDGEVKITNVIFKDKERLGPTRDQRGLIYDVYCETDEGKRFILEMQNKWQPYFFDRSICYASRSILEQVERSKTEKEGAYLFLPVYTVCFLNYRQREDGFTKFRTDIVLADKEDGTIASDKLRFIYLAMPLFDKEVDECVTDFDKWIYVLKHMEALSRMPFTAQKDVFKQLEEYADIHHLNKKEDEAYQNSLWVARDYAAIMSAAEREAKEYGLAQGLKKGMEKGMEKGRTEANRQTALRLLAMGLAPQQIAEATQLSLDEVKALQAN